MRHYNFDSVLCVIDRAEDRAGIWNFRKEGEARSHPCRISCRIKRPVDHRGLAERECGGFDQRIY